MDKSAATASPADPSKPASEASLYMGEASTSVSLMSFMTALVFFFAGLLLTGSAENQVRLRVPLSMLFLSAFGFLYATLIYANATGEIARRHRHGFDRQMSVANVVSEYFGVYGLVLAIPLTVLGYSPDRPLAMIVLILAVTGLWFYHSLGYSIMERYYSRQRTTALMVSILAINIGQFVSFYMDIPALYYLLSACLCGIFALLTASGIRRGHE
jgi:hypothetical protein